MNPAPARPQDRGGRAVLSLETALPFLLALAVWISFLPVLGNGFVWDDGPNFLENPRIRSLAWENLRWMFTQTYLGPYQPLAWLFSALQYACWGLNPAGYHLASVALHAANALLFYRISARLLVRALPTAASAAKSRLSWCAFAAAFLFSIHPLRMESVAFVTEQRGLLSGVFYLSALLLYLRMNADDPPGLPDGQAFARAPRSAAPPPPDARLSRAFSLTGTAGLYMLSLLSKASGLALPITLVVLDVYPLRRLDGDPRRWASAHARRVLGEKTPFLVLGALMAAADWRGYSRTVGLVPLSRFGAADRLAEAAYGLAFYFWKTLAPSRLLPLYEIPRPMDPLRPAFLLAAAACAGLTIAFVALRRRWPAGLAAWIHYAATLGPVCGLVQFAPHLAADRYSYLACLSWPLAASGAALAVWTRPRAGKSLSILASPPAILVAGILVWETRVQARIWRDNRALWSHVASAAPNRPTGLYNLANDLSARGEYDEAVRLYRAAAALDPGAANIRVNLGIALASRRDAADAIREFREALRLDPGNAAARINLGSALADQGDWSAALEEFSAGLASAPSDPVIHNNIGILLARRGLYNQAIARFRRAMELRPGFREAADNLRRALADRRRNGGGPPP